MIQLCYVQRCGSTLVHPVTAQAMIYHYWTTTMQQQMPQSIDPTLLLMVRRQCRCVPQ
jgi:hypothetical protein